MSRFLEIVFKNMRGIISLTTVYGCFIIIGILLFRNIPTRNSELIYLAIGLILGNYKDVSNYFFGATKDKTDAEKAARAADPSVNSEISPPKQSKP